MKLPLGVFPGKQLVSNGMDYTRHNKLRHYTNPSPLRREGRDFECTRDRDTASLNTVLS
jgi:hypothetical protein